MPLASKDTGSYIAGLDATIPADNSTPGKRGFGAAEIRKVKSELQAQFPNFTGKAVTASEDKLNYCDVTTLGTGENSKALTVDGSGGWTMAGKTCANLGIVTTVDINGGTWSGTIDGNWTAAGQSCADLGAVTTCDINGGSLDGVTIGASSAATITGASLGTAVTAVTQSSGDNSTKVATTAYADASGPTVTSELTLKANAFAGTSSVAHSVGSEPDMVECILECLIADAGYSVGDRIRLNASGGNVGGSGGVAWSVWLDATNINIRVSSGSWYVANKGSSAETIIAGGSWRIFAKAIKF